MTTIALPSVFVPSACSFKSVTNQRVSASNFGGSEQAVDLLNDRWTCSVTVQLMSYQAGGKLEAFIGQMRGQTNTCDLYHFVRPNPAGTARGSMFLGANLAQGAASMYVGGCSPANGTLLAGDMVGIAGMLFMVGADCTASGGNVTIPLAQRVRKAVTSGTVVVWDKPTAPFRLLNTSGVNYSGAVVEETTFDFGEAI